MHQKNHPTTWMAGIHSFISGYSRILKWIPFLNRFLLIYYVFRVVFIRRQMPRFLRILQAIGITVGTAVLIVATAQLLPLVLTTATSRQILDMLMPLFGHFVFVPVFVSLFVQADAEA